MKKAWLLVALLLGSLALAGCGCKCDTPTNENNNLTSVAQFCLDNWWTYSRVTSPDEEYGECVFPSWVGCRDELILANECDFQPYLEDIDTEEERRLWCEENAQWWVEDMIPWAELLRIDWDEEWEQETLDEAGNITIIHRDFNIKYNHDWHLWSLPWVCEANFIDWSLWVSYGQEFIYE